MNIDFNAAALGEVTAGEVGDEGLAQLQKALTATPYTTDVATLSGAGALRVQSLDKTMKATILENDQFKLFNELAKASAGAIVDEWTERPAIGGYEGGTANSETGDIQEETGEYYRRVGQVKFLMTRAQVSLISTLGNNIASAKASEAQNAALRLLRDAEHLSWYGNDAVVSTEFAGIFAQMEAGVAAGQVDGRNIVNADGGALSGIEAVNSAAAQVAGWDNFGRGTHLFMSQDTQVDFDNDLDPAYRVNLPDVPAGGITLGSPVIGIRTSWGNIKTVNNVFIRDEKLQVPFQIRYAARATANTGMKPTLASVVAATGTASNMFTAPRAGNYYYLVTGLRAGAGESDGVISAQTAVTAGQKVTVTITASAGGQETGYAVYRSRQNGTNAPSDFRLIKRIPKTASSTVFVDENLDMPGSTQAALLNMGRGADAINWRQMLPMTEFQLYPTTAAVLPWAQLLCGYLRITKRRQHAVIKNIVPGKALWKPHG